MSLIPAAMVFECTTWIGGYVTRLPFVPVYGTKVGYETVSLLLYYDWYLSGRRSYCRLG